jgi:hypothetical protein
MPSWLKTLTYVASVACSIAANVFPMYHTPLLCASTGLLGWATTHPSDVAPTLTVTPNPKGLS